MTSNFFSPTMIAVIKSSFASRFVAAREAVEGLTKYRLFKLSGVSQPALSRIESGHNVPTDETIAMLAPSMGVPVATMIEWANAERSERATQRHLGAIGTFPQHLEILSSASDAPYPPSPDERESIQEASRVGVWTTDLDRPELWTLPPDDARRVGLFEYLGRLIAEAKAYREGAI